MKERKILVVVDPSSNEQGAVQRAAQLAEHLSARLELFLCHVDAGGNRILQSGKAAGDEMMTTLKMRLEDLATALRERGLDVDTELAFNPSLCKGIVSKALASKPWMVVKDTHHHNVLKRTFLSNTDWELIRQCPLPLLLVKMNTSSASHKICAAIDPMHENDKSAELDHSIFEMAATLATATGAELHLVHTYAVPSEPVGLEAPATGSISEVISQQHKSAFVEFLRTHRVPDTNAHLLHGVAHKRLVEFSIKESIDLMVMGAVSRRALDRIFIGSTAERILERLPCDLLIVKPERIRSAQVCEQ